MFHPRIPFFVLLLATFGATGCSPFYTWGYTPAIPPKAVTAYIYAVMAREAGDDQTALEFYDQALQLQWSQKVKDERDLVAKRLK